ncbi:MAG: BREX-4 system phosphatase PglZ [Eubacteriales bacterium]|nr:BREX-4 system phosphatase PglZ [Eubacteriales bacterium]
MLSVNDAIKQISAYLSGTSASPFFVVADGAGEYAAILSRFASLKRIRVSDYCGDDSFADYDKLCDAIEGVSNNSILVGLGDIIALSGKAKILSRISGMTPTGRVVILCRGIHAHILKLNEIDRKFNSRRYCEIGASLDYSIIRVKPDIEFPAEDSLKDLMRSLEDGKDGTLYVKTNMLINSNHSITSSYEAIRELRKTFQVPESTLSAQQWYGYYTDNNLDGYGILDWQTYLKLWLQPSSNDYLKRVMAVSPSYDDYRKRIFDTIFDVPVKAREYRNLYAQRKDLLKEVAESDVSSYVAMSMQKGSERIFYLTDNTQVERYAIIEELSRMKEIPQALTWVYPALSLYLTDYTFTDKKSEVFTSYFAQYKRQKITNRLDDDFLDTVTALATDGNRVYNALETRGAIVEKLNNGKNELYWIDALGVEFLGYIQMKARELGLSIRIKIGRAVLPTLTYLNRDFYDEWKCAKTTTKKLDGIKHNGEDEFNYEKQKAPIHLAEELKVIDRALEWAKDELLQSRTPCVVIASDHGASRLAVIRESENKWEMATMGQHSGRCCPTNEIDDKPTTATEEHGFWVLADYDRFKGGRRASVEVHGGASLEEVLVPIIEISLTSGVIELKNMTDIAWASFDEDPFIEIFSPAVIENMALRFNNRLYYSESISKNMHKVVFDDFKRSGAYTAEVLDGDNLIGSISFKIEKRSGKTKASEEDEFFI